MRQIDDRPATARRLVRIGPSDPFDLAAAALFAILTGLALLTFRDYAVSNDEGVQHQYGELILRYYASGFADRSLFEFDNLYLYGGLFDIVAVALARQLPLFDPYELRHILCALIGVSGIGFAWATARQIAGPRAALIAAASLATCGSWYGCMFNHTKDIPLATAMAGAVYFLVLLARDLPRPRPPHVVGFGVFAGAALGIKVVGLMLVAYAAIAILLRLPSPIRHHAGAGVRFALRSAAALLPAAVIAWAIMAAAWPWSALAPLNPLRALLNFADFHYDISTILHGQRYYMATSPRSYVPVYVLIKMPLLTLAGAAVALTLLPLRRARAWAVGTRRQDVALIAVAALLPLAAQYAARGPAFTGMRHFLFVVPMLCVLAGIGWDAVLTRLGRDRRAGAAAAAIALAAVVVFDASLLVRLHPHQYMSYNPLVGGLAGASRRYVMDYWVNIMPEAVRHLERHLDRSGAPPGAEGAGPYTVAACGERVSFAHETRRSARLQWTSHWEGADFFIAPTHMDCDLVLDGVPVARIERLGVLIGIVKDRRALVPRRIGNAGDPPP